MRGLPQELRRLCGSYNARWVTRVSLSDWLALQARIRGFENPRLLRDRPSDEAASACGNWGAVPSNRVWGFGLCGYCGPSCGRDCNGLRTYMRAYIGAWVAAGAWAAILWWASWTNVKGGRESLYFKTPANEPKWLRLRKFH